MMKVCIVSVLIFALYIGAEAQQGGSGSNGRGRGGGRGGRVGKPWKKPRKGNNSAEIRGSCPTFIRIYLHLF